MPIACVDLIIVCQDKYLLMKRNNPPAKNQWWFCGGRVMKGETIEHAAIRKAKEETGLDVSIRNLVCVTETDFPDGMCSIPTHTINMTYLAISHSFEVNKDYQNCEHKWVSINEIPHDLDIRLQDALRLCFDV